MIKVADAAVQAAAKCYAERVVSINDTFSSLAREMLTAALPHLLLGFEVKQLEWVCIPACNGILQAKTNLGTYSIGSNKTVRLGLKPLSRPFQLLDDAKAFAQADFERRVHECIVGAVTDGGAKAVDVGELSGNSRQLKSVDMVANDLSEMFDSYSPTAIELLNELKCRLESYPEPDLDELRAKCDAAIEALSAEPAQGEQWQPIETAPKDGTRILVWIFEAQTTRIVRWKSGHPTHPWASDEGSHWKGSLVTHWVPLPTAPTTEAAE